MKLLINRLAETEIKALEVLREKIEIDEVYIITHEGSDRWMKQSSLVDVMVEKYMYLDMVDAQYESYLFYNEMRPLDQEILDQMARYEPEALKMLERAGRVNDSAERRFMQYHTHVRYWNYFLDRTKVDCFMTHGAPHNIYDYIIMRLCQIKGILISQSEWMPFQSCLKLRYCMKYDDYDVNMENEIKRYQAEFAANPSKKLSERMQREYELFCGAKKRVFKISPSQKGIFKARILFLGLLWKRDKRNALSRTIKHFTAKRATKRLLSEYEKMTVQPDYRKKYIYFPLQYQPEETTCPRGGWYVHQYLAIEMLSYYLPDDAVIYVKEHPCMKEVLPVHTRILQHYKRIDKLKNVFLIPIETSTLEMTNHAIAVASMTGSVGFEALFKKKPYLVFGHSILKYAPNALNIRTNSDCRNALDKVFGDGIKIGDADIKAFLMAVDEASIEVFDEELAPDYDKEKAVEQIVPIYSDILAKK